MYLTASDFYTYHRPSKCDLRVYLRHRGDDESPPGPFDEVIRRLGQLHEKKHLVSFPSFVDLSSGTPEERIQKTKEEVKKGAPTVYQAALKANTELNGIRCEVLGEPDFLLKETDQYVIRDSKISRRITGKDHPEILSQLQIYGWLYEQTFSKPPARLEVHSGTGEIVPIPYDGGVDALTLLREILTMKQLGAEPYSPVGWTKCGNCGFHDRCWPKAETNRDVALVNGVDQGLAIALKRENINTADQLCFHFVGTNFVGFQRP